MFSENSFTAVACKLKLRVINPSYLKKLSKWYNFYETNPPVSAMKYRLDFLLSCSNYLNLHWKLHFSNIYSMYNFKIFCPSNLTMKALNMALKLVNFIDIVFHVQL